LSKCVAIRHIDLNLAEPAVPDSAVVLDIFWWKALPLGARVTLVGELPLGLGQLRQLTAEFAAEQLAAREPALGAPLRATHEGLAKPALTIERAAQIDRPIDRLDWLAQPSTASAEEISLIICSRDRCAALAVCLASINGQCSPPGEIIVVDNSQDGSARSTCECVPGVVYVHQPRPGLSPARNAGLHAATRDLIAFTDDDVEPHPGWLAEIARVFENPDVDAVTGLVLPANLDTPAQRCFQLDMGGFGSKFVPTIFDQRFFAETRPYGAHVWNIGAGANMAFRRTVFERAGLFDQRLGAGASGCSEDSEFWYRLLALGGTCFYEPRAVVFHHHRDEWAALRRQVRAYMRGHVSALVAQYDAFNDRGNLRRIAKQLPEYFVRTAINSIRHGEWERQAMLVQEVLGWLAGLQYLVRPKWRLDRVDRPTR
jgi:glycosyltransferase involved in cell wall biosynthesis